MMLHQPLTNPTMTPTMTPEAAATPENFFFPFFCLPCDTNNAFDGNNNNNNGYGSNDTIHIESLATCSRGAIGNEFETMVHFSSSRSSSQQQ
mmetsp:Transcript_19729/g.40713  ORF Transcript_19729/g.40713 Transcript_19729/m.40713 type:complete len:92 (-) Transcript_19729:12-287(-)